VTTWRSFYLCCFGRVRKTALRELHTHHKKKKVFPVYEGKKVFLTLRGGSSSLIFTTIGYKKTHTHSIYCILEDSFNGGNVPSATTRGNKKYINLFQRVQDT
jgi:hypothetical protein